GVLEMEGAGDLAGADLSGLPADEGEEVVLGGKGRLGMWAFHAINSASKTRMYNWSYKHERGGSPGAATRCAPLSFDGDASRLRSDRPCGRGCRRWPAPWAWPPSSAAAGPCGPCCAAGRRPPGWRQPSPRQPCSQRPWLWSAACRRRAPPWLPVVRSPVRA